MDMGPKMLQKDLIDYEAIFSLPKNVFALARTLWEMDEEKMLTRGNPDGYFYLFYLKQCAILFFIGKCFNFNMGSYYIGICDSSAWVHILEGDRV